MVEVFRTNVESEGQAAWVLEELSAAFPDHALNFDLEDCDRILRAEAGVIDCNGIVRLLSQYGFCAEVLPDEVPA